jgi:hypothetical protein
MGSVAAGVRPGPAQASTITFLFDCRITNTATSTCSPGGPFGTLTLTDSLVDPNRVDIDLALAPLFGDSLEKVYMNWVPAFLTNHKFYLVPQNAAPGVASNNPYPVKLGTVLYGDSVYSLGKFSFDINTSFPSQTGFIFQGSLALYNQVPAIDTPVNIDVANFIATSGGTGTPPLYAAYRTNNCSQNCNGYSGEFWAGASTTVSEPATLLVLGVGLVGLGALVARQRRPRSPRPEQGDRVT